MELHNPNLRRRKNLMVSSRMFSLKVNTNRSLLWIDMPHSCMILWCKELAMELGPVFAYLFQQSIDTGEIPKEWSLANICPLLKKGDRSLARNYRPVSFFDMHSL